LHRPVVSPPELTLNCSPPSSFTTVNGNRLETITNRMFYNDAHQPRTFNNCSCAGAHAITPPPPAAKTRPHEPEAGAKCPRTPDGHGSMCSLPHRYPRITGASSTLSPPKHLPSNWLAPLY